MDEPLQADVSMAEALVSAPIDANGNLTADGARTFEWDARNQLVAVTVGTHRSEFVYDGLQRRVRQVEKDNGVTTADTGVLWCETAICEERAADGVTVTRRAFGLGEQINGAAHFFTTDHLGSVREVTDTAGALLARYAFDPWGRRTVTAGTDVTTVGFTGHRTHTSSGLALALYRGYDAGLARWVSEDPIGARGGPHRSAYVVNAPLVWVDPLGLQLANNSSSPVLVKVEDYSGGFQWVPPKGRYDGPIDGAKPPAWGGDWYKVPDGTRVTITEHGTPEETGGPGRWIPDIPDWGSWCDAAGGRKRNPEWERRHSDWRYPPDDPTRDPSRSRRPQ